MIRLSRLNKLILSIFFFTILISNNSWSSTAVDIWEKKESKKEEVNKENKKKIK